MGPLHALLFVILFSGSAADLHPGDSILVDRTDGSTLIGSVVGVTLEEISLDVGERIVTVPWRNISDWHRFDAAASPRVRVGATPGMRVVTGREAFAIAFAGTLASYGMLALGGSLPDSIRGPIAILGVLGIYIAPSAGHFYAGETGRGFATIGVRVAATAVFAASIIVYFSHQCGGGGSGGSDAAVSCGGPAPAWALPTAMLAAATFVGVTLYDVVDSARAPTRVRARRVTIAPAPLFAKRGAVPGLVIAARF